MEPDEDPDYDLFQWQASITPMLEFDWLGVQIRITAGAGSLRSETSGELVVEGRLMGKLLDEAAEPPAGRRTDDQRLQTRIKMLEGVWLSAADLAPTGTASATLRWRGVVITFELTPTRWRIPPEVVTLAKGRKFTRPSSAHVRRRRCTTRRYWRTPRRATPTSLTTTTAASTESTTRGSSA